MTPRVVVGGMVILLVLFSFWKSFREDPEFTKEVFWVLFSLGFVLILGAYLFGATIENRWDWIVR